MKAADAMAQDELDAADYFATAIQNGHCHQLRADLNRLDAMLRELGMQDSDDDPVEAIRKLQRAARGAMRG